MNERIKKLRKALDLTQQEFGDRIGIKRNSVALIESGRNTSDQTIMAICREFKVNEKWLRAGEGEMFAPDSSDELEALAERYDMSAGERVFLEKYFSLKRAERDKVFEFLSDVYEGIRGTEPEEPAPETPSGSDLEDLTIDEKVELYRQELLREEKKESGVS